MASNPECVTNYGLNILLAKLVAAGCSKRQTNPSEQAKRIRSIIQGVIIQREEKDRRGNVGHFHWQVEHFQVDAFILYTDSSVSCVVAMFAFHFHRQLVAHVKPISSVSVFKAGSC